MLGQPVAPAGALAGVGRGVVPDAELVGVAARGQAGAGRDADGEVAVGGVEAGAALGQGVEVWGVGQGMAVAAGGGAAVLVGGDEQEVQRMDGHGVSGLSWWVVPTGGASS